MKTMICVRSALLSVIILSGFSGTGLGQSLPIFRPSGSLTTPDAKDQDDACIWVHPHDPSQSVVITSDKSASLVFVFDLEGKLLQSIPVAKPGNIDLRQNVVMGSESLDVVVVNQRSQGFALVVFRVIPESRTLQRIDADCSTDPNYGGCLFRSPRTQRLYFFCTSEEGSISQYELSGNSDRRVVATKVRSLRTGKCEGAVADDDGGFLYVSDEAAGVWKFSAEPDASSAGSLIATVGEGGLHGDVEGLALWKPSADHSFLVVSDQGINRFAVYDCARSCTFLGAFQIEGVGETDGIDICTANLGPGFPEGIFVCHNGLAPASVSLTPMGSIKAVLPQSSQR